MSEQSTINFEYLNAKELRDSSEKTFLLDVRSPLEFQSEHIASAVNIPLDQLESQINTVQNPGKLVVICKSGKRAERAAYMLKSNGFHPIVLRGGITAWLSLGFPVVEGKKIISIERQIQLVIGTGVLGGVLAGIFINKYFFILPLFFGAGLTFAGITGTCGLGILLSKASWNQLRMPSSPSAADTKSNKPSCCG